MRSVDERVAAVQRRTKRLRMRRNDRALAMAACLMMLPLAGLAGSYVTGSLAVPAATDAGLFGAASLFGSSAGGYVLVAVVSFAFAVLITVLLMLRRRPWTKDDKKTAKTRKTGAER